MSVQDESMPQQGEEIFICMHLLAGEGEVRRFYLIEGLGTRTVEMDGGIPVTSKWMGICDRCFRAQSTYDNLIGGSVTWNDSAEPLVPARGERK